ncbi:hypothetical protein D9756_002731 [Leucocoprinus leucothites]|uniref:DUF590-domain-containing protein n=1 Tax=Leucocoprinus leucothites TaxID=201217 RepID=A0A8H5LMB6_9AGAR|nr:hypothetical protein D9756_002731 [Leucoagaricus leucothites]
MSYRSALPPEVDIVVVFRATSKNTHAKQQTKDEARKAEQQYVRLIDTLTYAGLKAVGRRGESLGQLLVFVSCPQTHLEHLVRKERHADFLSGLPITPATRDSAIGPLSPADRIRLVHGYIASTPTDGGLGISPGSSEWDLVESITPLHDRSFNETWVRSWKPRQIGSVQLSRIREQFGDSVGLYFAFLGSYTQFLVFPAALGLFSYFFLAPYSPLFSILLCTWSVVFVEWWRVRERILSLRFGTRGSFRVEKRRASFKLGQTWWGREIRILASLPVILLFAGILIAILTFIFVAEAFVTHLYQGPGRQLIGFSPTILFVVLVPRVLALYRALAVRLTSWENHSHQSSHNASLTLKTFACSAIVAYMSLGLSAFVYVPFGEGVMRFVQHWLFSGAIGSLTNSGLTSRIIAVLNGTAVQASIATNGSAAEKVAPGPKGGIWDMDVNSARQKLNPARLRNQMFAYTVTNQIVNTFLEVGLPFVMRFVTAFRNGRNAPKPGSPGGEPKKRVVFEDEKEKGGLEERMFLEKVREEVALPEYNLFEDYNEMVIQFGYVVLWATIWPLAGVMALINNVFELQSDAFKLTVHHRRPIPTRTDTVGPWLDALTFLTWLGALTNSALVYLFSPEFLKSSALPSTVSVLQAKEHLVDASGANPSGVWGVDGSSEETYNATKELLVKAVLVALAASHGYIILRIIVRHIVERIWWKGSREVQESEREESSMKERFLEGAGASIYAAKNISEPGEEVKPSVETESEAEDKMGFWGHDEGVDEIKRLVKEA